MHPITRPLPAMHWALKGVFDIGIVCPVRRRLKDHRRLFERLRTGIEGVSVIANILAHLGFPTRAPPRLAARSFDLSKRPDHKPIPDSIRFSPWADPPHLARDAKMSQNLAPRADEWPEKSSILDRGLACLTTHWSISTLLS